MYLVKVHPAHFSLSFENSETLASEEPYYYWCLHKQKSRIYMHEMVGRDFLSLMCWKAVPCLPSLACQSLAVGRHLTLTCKLWAGGMRSILLLVPLSLSLRPRRTRSCRKCRRQTPVATTAFGGGESANKVSVEPPPPFSLPDCPPPPCSQFRSLQHWLSFAPESSLLQMIVRIYNLSIPWALPVTITYIF